MMQISEGHLPKDVLLVQQKKKITVWYFVWPAKDGAGATDKEMEQVLAGIEFRNCYYSLLNSVEPYRAAGCCWWERAERLWLGTAADIVLFGGDGR